LDIYSHGSYCHVCLLLTAVEVAATMEEIVA
jgi:hypothetical protein